MGCKEGTGKILVFVFTIIFAIGVIVSCSTPQWIAFTATESDGQQEQQQRQMEVQYGPFYSQTRTCTAGADCTGWETQSVDLGDCESVEESAAHLCKHLNTWRALAICCLLIVVIGGIIVLAGACCQMVTCGCCGASMDCIANVMFWVEVILSIVAWCFAISSVNTIGEAPQVIETGYLWGFWLFIVSGTIIGAICAITADWAADSSCFRFIFRCLTCRCNKD